MLLPKKWPLSALLFPPHKRLGGIFTIFTYKTPTNSSLVYKNLGLKVLCEGDNIIPKIFCQ